MIFEDYAAAHRFIQEHDIRMIDLKFCGLWGRWHHVTLSARQFTPETLVSGVGFDGSSVGLRNVKSGDMALIPDLTTAYVDPFWDLPTLSFLCNTIEADTKNRFERDPRLIAQHADQYLQKTLSGSVSRWGPEFEFYVFNKISVENSVNVSSYRVEAIEAAWNQAEGGHGHYLPLHGGYHAIPPGDQLFNLRAQMSNQLEEIGIPVKYHHHEVGGPGQCEIETPMMGLLAAGDAAMNIKYITRMVAHQAGQTVTFLPKPLYGEAGSGMHFHIQIVRDGTNLFYDPSARDLLSETARFFIGGLLTHAPALLAFTNPTTISYRRLVPGFEAPINSFYSYGNRSAAIRIPKYATDPSEVRFEFRPPDATCNPYLAMAAMLMAGLDGITQQIDPTSAGFGPINENIFSWPPEKRATIKSLPTSLEQALNCLQADPEFLLKENVFTPDLLEDWIKAKREEDNLLRARPHPYEIQVYYDL